MITCKLKTTTKAIQFVGTFESINEIMEHVDITEYRIIGTERGEVNLFVTGDDGLKQVYTGDWIVIVGASKSVVSNAIFNNLFGYGNFTIGVERVLL